MNVEKTNALIRLARKGRLLEIGKTAVEILLKRKRAHLVIIAADASDKLRVRIETACLRQNVPIFIFSTRSELGKICDRDNVAIVAIADKNLAAGISMNFL